MKFATENQEFLGTTAENKAIASDQKAELLRGISDNKYQNIRMLLVAANITQADIARRYGLTVSTINKVVTGRRKTLHVRQKIAEALNIPYTTLWSE